MFQLLQKTYMIWHLIETIETKLCQFCIQASKAVTMCPSQFSNSNHKYSSTKDSLSKEQLSHCLPDPFLFIYLFNLQGRATKVQGKSGGERERVRERELGAGHCDLMVHFPKRLQCLLWVVQSSETQHSLQFPKEESTDSGLPSNASEGHWHPEDQMQGSLNICSQVMAVSEVAA